MPPPLSTELLNKIQTAVDRDETLLAIKLYRDATGAGLADAKAFVDGLRGAPGPHHSIAADSHADSTSSDPEVLAALYAGNLITAIRTHREKCPGKGLAEAKVEMESLAQQLYREHPERFSTPPESRSGCSVKAALFFLVALGFILTLLVLK